LKRKSTELDMISGLRYPHKESLFNSIEFESSLQPLLPLHAF